MKWIEVHSLSGEKTLVNLDNVESVVERCEITTINFISSDGCVHIKEDYKDIAALLLKIGGPNEPECQ